jgi:ribosome-binding factor A
VGKRLRLRFTPELTFQYDVGIEATDRVARLLEETQVPGSSEPDDDDGDGEE